MSVYTAKTGMSSILKNYSASDRDKAKIAMLNKVRFDLPKDKGITAIVESVLSVGNYVAYNDFVLYLKEGDLDDTSFSRTVSEARKIVHLLNPNFSVLVETILSLEWRKRSKSAIEAFCEFYVDLLVAHSKYTPFAISKLISNWVPGDTEASLWKNSCPVDELRKELENVHALLERLLNIIPMTYDVVLEAIDKQYPYYKNPAHIITGYLHNILWLLEYKPSFTSHVTELIFRKILTLDVNAPRSEIEDAEVEEDDVDDPMFPIEGCSDKDYDAYMRHPVAETLDSCMEKMFDYIRRFTTSQNSSNFTDIASFYKLFFTVFEDVVLPSHNTHHIQFLMFYLCSFKPVLAEKFLKNLWAKVTNPNMSAPIRQASVGYVSSFLARSKFVSLSTLRNYLSEMCSWAHSYIHQSDSVRSNKSLKANIVFFSVCQAIFYVIALRSRDLTIDKRSLLFLQSLQLSAIVTCSFNPLRVCIPAVATAFAGVTRTYQLAYCHAILEKNARKKLATVYANETSMPEENLETFFPFDPYLLKRSGQQIAPIYLQYRVNEAEDDTDYHNSCLRRKRCESELEDIDDFIIDKKLRSSDLSRSYDKEFTYGLSPGFQV